MGDLEHIKSRVYFKISTFTSTTDSKCKLQCLIKMVHGYTILNLIF